MEVSPDGRQLAVARSTGVTLGPSDPTIEAPAGVRTIGQFPGPVTAVHFDAGGTRLITASGVDGLGGAAAIWSRPTVR